MGGCSIFKMTPTADNTSIYDAEAIGQSVCSMPPALALRLRLEEAGGMVQTRNDAIAGIIKNRIDV